MKRYTLIRLNFPSEKNLKTVLNALKPETRESPGGRSRTRVEEENGRLVVKFEAEDTSSLRAAINAYLRWIALTQNTLETVDGLSTNRE